MNTSREKTYFFFFNPRECQHLREEERKPRETGQKSGEETFLRNAENFISGKSVPNVSIGFYVWWYRESRPQLLWVKEEVAGEDMV